MSEARIRVLVADDDVDTVECMAAVFADLGAEVIKAYTGRMVVELALTSGPDVIVLDLEMPDMSGYEIARLLGSMPMPKRPLLVAVSGYGRQEIDISVLTPGSICILRSRLTS